MHTLWTAVIVLIAIILCTFMYPVVIAYMVLSGSSLLGQSDNRSNGLSCHRRQFWTPLSNLFLLCILEGQRPDVAVVLNIRIVLSGRQPRPGIGDMGSDLSGICLVRRVTRSMKTFPDSGSN